MADPENIDRFNRFAAEVFAMLYSHFPRRAHFNTTDFNVPLNEHGGVAGTDDFETIIATVRWLEEEGYIRMTTWDTNSGFHSVGLSAKGLAVLRLVPDVLPILPHSVSRFRVPSSLEPQW